MEKPERTTVRANGLPKKERLVSGGTTLAGRPQKVLDEKQVESMAALMCTMTEMAAHFNVSVDTLENNYSEIIKRGQERGKESLRRLQWKAAMQGNVTMQIWLGKQILKQRDPRDVALVFDPKDIDDLFDNTRNPLNNDRTS